jgi:hypothetical protein
MLFDILDHFSPPFATLDQASRFLHQLCGEFKVANLSYWHIGSRSAKPARRSGSRPIPNSIAQPISSVGCSAPIPPLS